MASPSPRNTNFADEPSIIIDPSLYVPERRFLLQTLCETFIDATRVLVMVTLSGTTAFGVAQALMRQEAGLDRPPTRVPAALPAEAAASVDGALDMSLARTSWWEPSAPVAEKVAPSA